MRQEANQKLGTPTMQPKFLSWLRGVYRTISDLNYLIFKTPICKHVAVPWVRRWDVVEQESYAAISTAPHLETQGQKAGSIKLGL